MTNYTVIKLFTDTNYKLNSFQEEIVARYRRITLRTPQSGSLAMFADPKLFWFIIASIFALGSIVALAKCQHEGVDIAERCPVRYDGLCFCQ